MLVTHDSDLLVEATQRQRAGVWFNGVVYEHLIDVTVGQLVRDLEMISPAYDPPDLVNRIEYVPM